MRLFDVEDRAAPPPAPAVRINGREISRVAITREIQNHPADNPVEARDAAVQALVVRELLLQEARAKGLVAEPLELGPGQHETDEDALVRQLLDDALTLPSPTEDECKRFYETNVDRFRSTAIWEPAHILLSVPPSDAAARTAARNKASEIIKLLGEQPDRFAQIARDYSTCPSREQGGNLGQISPGQTTPAFEAALKTMTPGTISSVPVETRYGFHVIRLDRCVEGRTLPFEAVHKKISDYLADAVFQRAVSQFVSLLAGKATIEGVEINRSLSPLVQ